MKREGRGEREVFRERGEYVGLPILAGIQHN